MLEPWLDELGRLGRYLDLVFPEEPPCPRWATDNREVEVSDTVHLRLFGGQSAGTPVLVVTPQVNHSYIADFSEKQSLVRTLLASGVKQVAVTDWQDPPEERAYSISDSITDLAGCIDSLGGRAHLTGLCQGGWQVAILAALRPELVESLTVAAAPMDTHVGATMMHAFTMGLPQWFFEALVGVGGGVAPGGQLAMGFNLLRPLERFFLDKMSLYLKLDDSDFVRRYQELSNWYQLNKDVPGQLYLEVVSELFRKNRLARGEMRVWGERVDLAAISCPVNLVAGTRDHITPPEQVFALEALAPRASVRRYLVDAGHIGVFMGRRALVTIWPEIAGRMGEE